MRCRIMNYLVLVTLLVTSVSLGEQTLPTTPVKVNLKKKLYLRSVINSSFMFRVRSTAMIGLPITDSSFL